MPKTDTLAPPGVGIRRGSVVAHIATGKLGIAWAEPLEEPDNGVHCAGLERYCADGKSGRFVASELRLWLLDPTSQMHAVWWIAEQMGLPEPTTAVMRWRGGHEWDIVVDRPRGVYPGGQPDIDACERRVVPRMTSGMQRLSERRGMHRLFVVVPALADIAPDDRAGAIAAIAAIMWALVEVTDAE